ncbi:dipeptidase [Litorimonas sp. RW-G-Af-16]|uniref:dipeptidase n=1 Tax=Litorimonas sp. RW-G-Af-16 TaxID=3241168 RepID=UPI00390C7618
MTHSTSPRFLITTTMLAALSLGLTACSDPVATNKPSASANKADQTLHERTLTLDTHIDIPLTYMKEIDPKWDTDLQVDLPKLREGALDSGFWIIYTPQGELDAAGYKAGLAIAETRYRAIQSFVVAYPEDVALALSAADVRETVAKGKHAVLMGMENAYPLGPTIDQVPLWARRGVRYMGITHFGHNQFGDSSNPNPVRDSGPRHNGLSTLGKALVRAMNENGIMVDVSHAGKQTMMQAADLSRTPIIASHSGAKAIADSPRNLDDEQLRKIAEVGGVAQMVALGAYVKVQTSAQLQALEAASIKYGVSNSQDYDALDDATKVLVDAERARIAAMEPLATVADFVDHIDHVVKVAGIDHVGIASDFDGGGGIIGWQDASETANVTDELVKRGYSEEDIAKIWGGNLLRVMESVEQTARR